MKYIVFILCFVALPTVAQEENPWTWNHGMHSLKNWDSEHWERQNFEPSIQKQGETLRYGVNQSQSMFANINGLNPNDFIENLKRARIIKGAFNQRTGFWKQNISADVVIELDENFYTLSPADKKAVTELLAKSYNQENYVLKDGATKRIVGQITPAGYHLF